MTIRSWTARCLWQTFLSNPIAKCRIYTRMFFFTRIKIWLARFGTRRHYNDKLPGMAREDWIEWTHRVSSQFLLARSGLYGVRLSNVYQTKKITATGVQLIALCLNFNSIYHWLSKAIRDCICNALWLDQKTHAIFSPNQYKNSSLAYSPVEWSRKLIPISRPMRCKTRSLGCSLTEGRWFFCIIVIVTTK